MDELIGILGTKACDVEHRFSFPALMFGLMPNEVMSPIMVPATTAVFLATRWGGGLNKDKLAIGICAVGNFSRDRNLVTRRC